MAIHKYIKCDVYNRGISVFFGTIDELHKWADHCQFSRDDKAFHRAIEDKVSDNPAFIPNYDDGQGIVFVTEISTTTKGLAHLEHELLHAVFHILDFCGVEYRYSGANEAYTYMLGYLTEEALKLEDYEEIVIEREDK